MRVVFSLDGNDAVTRRVLDRLAPLYGQAEYLLFLNRGTPGSNSEEPRYVANIDAGPSGVLAAWPGDGRFATVRGRNDLAEEAIARGEARTGQKDPPIDLAGPDFSGPPPVGLRGNEITERFARPVGSTETAEPPGWDAYQRVLERALQPHP